MGGPLKNLSQAQVVFGHSIRDFLPVRPGQFYPRPEWQLTSDQREPALAHRHLKRGSVLAEHTKPLKPLQVSDAVLVQNLKVTRPTKWDYTGTVVEVKDYDQYLVKMDGSGRATLRNRQFLKPVAPFMDPGTSDPIQQQQVDPDLPTPVPTEEENPSDADQPRPAIAEQPPPYDVDQPQHATVLDPLEGGGEEVRQPIRSHLTGALRRQPSLSCCLLQAPFPCTRLA